MPRRVVRYLWKKIYETPVRLPPVMNPSITGRDREDVAWTLANIARPTDAVKCCVFRHSDGRSQRLVLPTKSMLRRRPAGGRIHGIRGTSDGLAISVDAIDPPIRFGNQRGRRGRIAAFGRWYSRCAK